MVLGRSYPYKSKTALSFQGSGRHKSVAFQKSRTLPSSSHQRRGAFEQFGVVSSKKKLKY